MTKQFLRYAESQPARHKHGTGRHRQQPLKDGEAVARIGKFRSILLIRFFTWPVLGR